MVRCPHCQAMVDETVRQTCQVCLWPIYVAGAEAAATTPPQATGIPFEGPVTPRVPPESPQPIYPTSAASGVPLAEAAPNYPPTAPATVAAPTYPGASSGTTATAAPGPPPTGDSNAAHQATRSSLPYAEHTHYNYGDVNYEAQQPGGYTNLKINRGREITAPPSPAVMTAAAVAAVLAVLIIAGGWFFMLHRTNPKDQANLFFDALQHKDWKTVYATADVDTRNYPTADSYATYEQTANRHDVNNAVFSSVTFSVGDPVVQGSEAIVPVTKTVVIGQPMIRVANIKMTNFQGIWKLSRENSGFGDWSNGGFDLGEQTDAATGGSPGVGGSSGPPPPGTSASQP